MSDIIQNHKHIVFGFEHYNPLGIVRSLGENGIDPIGIIIKSNRPITSKSKYLKETYFVDGIEAGYDLLNEKFGNEVNKPFVYASDDQVTNYMDARFDEIKDKFYFYNAGKPNRIAEFQNKDNILQLAIEKGLNVLKTYAVSKGEIPEGLEYPIITKAIISTIDAWKDDMIICHNEDELKQAYKKIRSERVLLQKYIIKKNELCMEGCSASKGTKALISIASQYNYQLEDSYSPYMTVQNLNDSNLEKKLKDMLSEIGFEGIFEIEFLVDQEDELYFLEINLRNSTWSYASTVAGMPLPIIWACGMLNGSTIEDSYRKIERPFTAMVEFDDYRRRVKTNVISKRKWINDLKNSECKYYIGKRDIKPFLSVIFNKFKRSAHKED